MSMATNANVASTETHHYTSCFNDAFTTISASSLPETINTRKRSHSTIALYESPPESSSRERPPRRRNDGTSQQPRRRQRNGLSNICPPLDGPVGAPQLPVVTTKDPAIIARWLEENIGGSDNTNGYSVLGYDQESTAKPPWKPERANLPDGPATVQLSTPDSCLIVQLAICGDGSAMYAPEILRQVINNPKIIKVGVGIDDDALELFRWSKDSHKEEEMLWKMRSRFDIGCILPDTKSSRRAGLRELAQKVLGVEVPKSKKLAMSNWSKRHLTLNEISYAARDAWVAAAIVDKLQQFNSDIFAPESLVEMDFIKSERCTSIMDERAKRRKAAKIELKEILERQKAEGKDDEQERQQELYNILDMYRPDQPPTFHEDVITLELL